MGDVNLTDIQRFRIVTRRAELAFIRLGREALAPLFRWLNRSHKP